MKRISATRQQLSSPLVKKIATYRKHLLFILTITSLLASICALPPKSAEARYMKPDLVNIPIERLINNLEAIAEKNPKDAQARFNLARAHAMAYAVKSDTAEVWKGRENQGIWFGYEPSHIPFTVQPTEDKNALNAARKHLASAIKAYEETIRLEPDNLSAKLGYAWCLEQSGEKRKAVNHYRKVIEAAWRQEKSMTQAPLGWHSVTAEAAGYLIPLLNKNRDKKEISLLRARMEKVSKVPRPVTPVAVPLRVGMTAREVENLSASVAFDADGSGEKKNWTWIAKDAGWLVYDPHETGKVASALQMFGSVSFWMFWDNGYKALAALDDNGDGMLAGRELRGLAIWQDINSNGISDAGEVKRLAAWGIVGISCHHEQDTKHPYRIAYSRQGIFFRDGSTRPTYDIILRPALDALD